MPPLHVTYGHLPTTDHLIRFVLRLAAGGQLRAQPRTKRVRPVQAAVAGLRAAHAAWGDGFVGTRRWGA